jgi:hypothetical protein
VHNTLGFPRSLFEVLVCFGPGGNASEFTSRSCALHASFAPQGFALETPYSPPDFWLPLLPAVDTWGIIRITPPLSAFLLTTTWTTNGKRFGPETLPRCVLRGL